MVIYDIIIVGGGLAGLTASISLSKAGHSVLVLEKRTYPHHKVCGEYVSNEIRPFLEHLGLDLKGLRAVPIQYVCISNHKGKSRKAKLPLGGFGISRYTLDHALYKLAVKNGVHFQFEVVTSVQLQHHIFYVTTNKGTYKSELVIAAHGKRSHFDKYLNRPFIKDKSPWLGVKAHYQIDNFPEDHVMLHSFPGGYGGLSLTEQGTVNFCYLSNYKSFQKEKSIATFNANVVSQNPFLKTFLQEATPTFDEPLSIAQIAFTKKEQTKNSMLMCGDSAGLIHPLCGNGMAMAIHAAKLASDVMIRFFQDKTYTRDQMERDYQRQWKTTFALRLFIGRKIQAVMMNTTLFDSLFYLIPNSASFLRAIIKQTHGKTIFV